ncbi:MAG: PEP-CTERM sorting domain-containing protein [Planctomycetota bacterium]
MRRIEWIAAAMLWLAVDGKADELKVEVTSDIDGVVQSAGATENAFNVPAIAELILPEAGDQPVSGSAFTRAEQRNTVLGALGYVEAEAVFFSGNNANSVTALNTIVSTATQAGAHEYGIFITGAELRTLSYAGFVPSLVASYDVTLDVTRGGVTTRAFASSATLTGATLTKTGIDLGSSSIAGPEQGLQAGFAFDPLLDLIDVGILNPGDFVTYSYGVSVSGPGFETGGSAFFGDPSSLSNPPSSGALNRLLFTGPGDPASDPGPGPQPQPIPEPGTLALFAAGAAGLAWLRRRHVS